MQSTVCALGTRIFMVVFVSNSGKIPDMLKPEFKRKILATGLSVLFVAAQGWNVAAESAVIAPGAELQKLAGDFSFH